MKSSTSAAKLFAYVRSQRNYSYSTLAKKLGLVPSSVCRYEHGHRQPDHDTLIALVAVSGCRSLAELAYKAFRNLPLDAPYP